MRAHYEILANKGGRGRFSFTNFVSSITIKVWWFYVKAHSMGNLLGLSAKSVCGFFTRKSKMTSKMAAKTSIFSDNSPKTLKIKIKMQIFLC